MKENKLIAEFMGVKPNILGDEITYEMYGVIDCIEDGLDEQHFFLPDDMKFKKSWDWLMPVVNKIRSFDSHFEIEQIGVFDWDDEISHYEFMIDLTYNAVVEFIKQYNESTD